MKLDLSILVVTYHCQAFIRRFHQELTASLAAHDDWELLYQDNSPADDTWRILQATAGDQATLRRDAGNPGFAAATNRLIELSQKRWLLLLNPDVFGFDADFWPALFRHAREDSALFIRLLNGDGSAQDCVGRFSSLRRALMARADYAGLTEPTPVETGIMAFMLVRRELFERVGPLDERFFMYAEDMDWCYRAARLGIPRIYEPRLELTHLGGASAASEHDRRGQYRRKIEAERLFIKKHYRGTHRLAMLGVNALKHLKSGA